MFRTAFQKLHAHSADCVMFGDRMDTDVLGGLEAGMDTVLLLSGVTKSADVEQFCYRPTHILRGLDEVMQIVNLNQPSSLPMTPKGPHREATEAHG